MHMRKRTALLVASMGALLIGGAGGADAATPGPGLNDGGAQRNRCDTSSVIGGVQLTASDTTTETNCLNSAESGVTEQSNRCRTHSVIGPVTVALAPGSTTTNRTNCVNYSKSGGVTKQSNDCKTTSVLGPITIGPGEVTNETNCVNLAGTDDGSNNSGDGAKNG
ncbi:hypothetical protein SSOG_04082 [Streptomyces himastatinicus ATCC 53653]|uniref:Secreted protein n=1 Tax=Streptomyces himastatinicus ATCC 53653 TaxID=457427 RepID=D9WUD3_9ACTN|nr:hypothetical protein [Streptomyces himastatinicus]EFL24368.1 hypothetical protein SSOG_04082 [Streptomyces himastatinicus ATCC 53653]